MLLIILRCYGFFLNSSTTKLTKRHNLINCDNIVGTGSLVDYFDYTVCPKYTEKVISNKLETYAQKMKSIFS